MQFLLVRVYYNIMGDVILSGYYVLNMLPHKKIGKRPFQLWKNICA